MNTPVVLITGALTGIGRATAFAFAREGARIVVSGRRDEEGKKLVAEIRSIIWEEWADRYLKGSGLQEHVSNHLAAMALRFGENRYHRLTHDVEIVTGMKPMTIREWVRVHARTFEGEQPILSGLMPAS